MMDTHYQSTGQLPQESSPQLASEDTQAILTWRQPQEASRPAPSTTQGGMLVANSWQQRSQDSGPAPPQGPPL